LIAIGNTPLTPLKSPFKASSPIKAVSFKSFSLIIPEDAKMPMDIGRSYSVPIFNTSAGARFTVIF
jgi:hypothetical protein